MLGDDGTSTTGYILRIDLEWANQWFSLTEG